TFTPTSSAGASKTASNTPESGLFIICEPAGFVGEYCFPSRPTTFDGSCAALSSRASFDAPASVLLTVASLRCVAEPIARVLKPLSRNDWPTSSPSYKGGRNDKLTNSRRTYSSHDP